MDAISGTKTPVITLNDIQQPDSKPVKTAESGGKTPVEMGHSPVKNTVISGDSGIALPKPTGRRQRQFGTGHDIVITGGFTVSPQQREGRQRANQQ